MSASASASVSVSASVPTETKPKPDPDPGPESVPSPSTPSAPTPGLETESKGKEEQGKVEEGIEGKEAATSPAQRTTIAAAAEAPFGYFEDLGFPEVMVECFRVTLFSMFNLGVFYFIF